MTQTAQRMLIERDDGRRLYGTEAGQYVTPETIADLVRAQRAAIVRDARTGDDITSAVLAQNIVGKA
jgi:polyhydroxyalkanoate synthesis regulator protein